MTYTLIHKRRHVGRTPAPDAVPPPGDGSDVLVSTQTFVSTSGGSQTNIPHRFVAIFVKGDVPSTHHLVAKIGGVEQPTQYGEVNTYSDGSIRKAVFRLFVPSLSAAATVTWQFYKRAGVYSPGVDPRSNSEITAHDFKTTLTDVRNGAGTLQGVAGNYTCAVNTNIAVAARTRVIDSGVNCRVLRTWGKFVDDGNSTENAFMTEADVIESWTSPVDGSLYAICHSGWVRSGWRAVASPESYITQAKRKDGASVLLDMTGLTYSFTTANVDLAANTITVSGTPIRTGECVYASGTLPGGLSTLTPYWIFRDFTTGKIKLYQDAQFQSIADLTSNPAGTCTLTARQTVPYHGGFHLRDLDGKEDWTAHEPLINPAFTAFEKVYWEKAGVVPPWDTAATPAAGLTINYYPGSLACPTSGDGTSPGYGIRRDMEDPGETPQLYHHNWMANAFMRMDATIIQSVNVLALCYAHIAATWLDETLVGGQECYRCLTLNNGPDDAGTPYSPMGTPRPSSFFGSWFSGASHSADIASWGYLGAVQAASRLQEGPCHISIGGTHYQPIGYMGYLLTGDPHLLDALYHSANESFFTIFGARTRTYRTVTYYGNWSQLNEPRAEGYNIHHVMGAATMAPDSDPESSYFRDLMNDTLAYLVDYQNHADASYDLYGVQGPLQTGEGISPVPGQGQYYFVAAYMRHWSCQEWLRLGRFWGTADAITCAAHFGKWFKTMSAPGSFMGKGPYMANSFTTFLRTQATDTAWLPPSEWAVNDGGTVTFNAGNTVTANGLAISVLQNGDKCYLADLNPATTDLPYGGPYYVINWNGTTHQLAAGPPPDTTPIVFTAGTGRLAWVYQLTSSVGFGGTSSDYARMLTCGCVMRTAYGYGDAAITTDMLQRLADEGASWLLSNDSRFQYSQTVL